MSTKRVQLRRTKGWRLPPDTIVVARPSRWGNPWRVGQDVTVSVAGVMACPAVGEYGVDDARWFDLSFDTKLDAGRAVALYRRDLLGNLDDGDECYDDLRSAFDALRGHDLACWCPLDQPCHADVLLEVARLNEYEIARLADARYDEALA